MEDLRFIIREIKKICIEEDLIVSPDILFDASVRIFNSSNINKHLEQKETPKQDEPMTDKQKWRLSKLKKEGIYNGSLDISKKQATQEIKKFMQ